MMNNMIASSSKLRHFQACQQDPLFDDSILFARHLQKLTVNHRLIIVTNLPHGFLNFYRANRASRKLTDEIMRDFARKFQIDGPYRFVSKKKLNKSFSLL
mgnify:CR=1 FL=1